MNKIVALFLDGWGISSSWKGNAISTANPKNFNSFFNDYQGVLLKTREKKDQSLISSDYYYSLGCGQIIESREDKVLKKIKNAEFLNNSGLFPLVRNITSYNSAIHIVADFVDSKNLEICKALLQYFKAEQIEKIYFHIIIPDKQTLDSFKNIIRTTGIGQLLSFYDRSFSDASMDFDKAEKLFLSVLFSKHPKSENFNFGENYDHLKIAVSVADNDSIIILNKERSLMREFSLLVSGHHRFATYNNYPYNLSIMVLYPQHLPLALEKKITPIFPDDIFESSLSNILSSAGISQCKIFPKAKELDFCYYFNGCLSKIFPAETRIIVDEQTNYKEITSQIIRSLKSRSKDIVFASLPLLAEIDENSDINEIAERVIEIDDCLLKIAEIAILEKTNLIITSPYSGAEKLINRNLPSAVPFILINNNQKKSSKKMDFAPTPFISVDKSTVDIAPTIIDLFNLIIPKQMKGKSLLK